MKPIVIDDDVVDDEKEKERKRKVERRRVMLERAKKRLLGFREPADEKDKKEEGNTSAEEWNANENPFWQPPMYIPAEGPCAEDFQISTDEYVEVRDMGLQWLGKYRCVLRYRERWVYVDSKAHRANARSVRCVRTSD